MRRTPLPALFPVLAGLVLVLAGCGGDEETKSEPLGPLGGDESSASSEPSADADAGAGTESEDATPFDDEGHDAIRGTVEAATPDEEAIADAWFGYWDVRVKSFGEVAVDPQIGTVAAGEAQADVVRYVSYLRGKKLHTEGDTKFSVSEITIRGADATLSSCGVNKSVDVDAAGSPAEQFTPFYNLKGTLKKAAGTWRVVNVDVVGTNGCKA